MATVAWFVGFQRQFFHLAHKVRAGSQGVNPCADEHDAEENQGDYLKDFSALNRA